MKPTFSLVINHTRFKPQRVVALDVMRRALGVDRGDVEAFFLNDTDYRALDWQQAKVQWALAQWRWSADKFVTHHVFMTDDLHIMPGFWEALSAMVEVRPNLPIGLLSNSPRGPLLFTEGGHHGYRTNSWIVGPAYVLSHEHLCEFLAWFESLPDGSHLTYGTKAYRNDDSSINQWNTEHGPGQAFHPLPTIIEHRADIESTTGHGDKYSRERVSWRAVRSVAPNGDGFRWVSEPLEADIEAMKKRAFWETEAPMLAVGE